MKLTAKGLNLLITNFTSWSLDLYRNGVSDMLYEDKEEYVLVSNFILQELHDRDLKHKYLRKLVTTIIRRF